MTLAILAPAKVNLYLHVGPVRSDGRHPLDSLVVFAGPEAADIITFDPDDTGDLTLAITGEEAPEDDPTLHSVDNLVIRAASLFETETGIELSGHLTLVKRLPVAAGIGGGSSDAAATLRLFQQLHNNPIPHDRMLELSASLGGDVPACYLGVPCRMAGDGDRVEALSWRIPRFGAVLVNPRVPCPTGPVFRAFDALSSNNAFKESPIPDFYDLLSLFSFLNDMARNDLEPAARDTCNMVEPVLSALKATQAPRHVSLSGSGATCFALYDTVEQAGVQARAIRSTHPNWWVKATSFGAAPFDLVDVSE